MSRSARLDEAIADFHRTREGDGLKLNTRKNDRYVLNRFLEETGNLYVRSISERNIDRHFAAIATGPRALSPTSINLHVQVLNLFWAHCARHGFIARDFNPMGTKKRVRKVAPVSRHFIAVDQFEALLDAADNPRTRMFLALGLYLFLRQSEMATLQWKDIDFTNREVFVNIHKTYDVDTMPMSVELEEELRRYATWYTEQVGSIDPEYYVVPRRQVIYGQASNGQLVVLGFELKPRSQATNIHDHIKKALQALGMPTYKQGAHTLRRSGARARFDAMVDMGYDGALQHVRAMLHHASGTMTEYYLDINIERKKRDDMVKGQPMFPSVRRSSTVVDLFKRDVKDAANG